MTPSLLRRRVGTTLFVGLMACAGNLAHAADLTVSAAASLTNAFKELGPAFEAQNAVVTLALVEAAGSAGAGGSAGGVEVLTANGYVVPRKKASVSSEVGGRLAALYVTEGDTATAGQVLGVLRNDDFRSAIAGNEARLAQTRAALTEARAALSLTPTEPFLPREPRPPGHRSGTRSGSKVRRRD